MTPVMSLKTEGMAQRFLCTGAYAYYTVHTYIHTYEVWYVGS